MKIHAWAHTRPPLKWNLVSFDDGNDKKTLNKHSYTEKNI